MKIIGLFVVVFGGFFIFPKPIAAHAFGQLYNLPVPFWLYLYGAAAALIVSFLLIGYFFNQRSHDFNCPRLLLFKISTKSPPKTILKVVSIFFSCLLLVPEFWVLIAHTQIST